MPGPGARPRQRWYRPVTPVRMRRSPSSVSSPTCVRQRRRIGTRSCQHGYWPGTARSSRSRRGDRDRAVSPQADQVGQHQVGQHQVGKQRPGQAGPQAHAAAATCRCGRHAQASTGRPPPALCQPAPEPEDPGAGGRPRVPQRGHPAGGLAWASHESARSARPDLDPACKEGLEPAMAAPGLADPCRHSRDRDLSRCLGLPHASARCRARQAARQPRRARPGSPRLLAPDPGRRPFCVRSRQRSRSDDRRHDRACMILCNVGLAGGGSRSLRCGGLPCARQGADADLAAGRGLRSAGGLGWVYGGSGCWVLLSRAWRMRVRRVVSEKGFSRRSIWGSRAPWVSRMGWA